MKLLVFLLLFPIITFAYLTVPPIQGNYCTTSNPDFIEFRYAEQVPICRRNVTTQQKNEICLRDGVTNRADFTVDHLIPLSLGGDNSFDNLWCQHKSINVTHDEYMEYIAVRDASKPIKDAIEHILDLKFKR